MKSFGIIILASERSGSNLLRTLLGNHSNISAPVAPHLIKTFYPIKHYYLNLHNHQNNKNLFDDMIKIVNHPFSDWKLTLSYERDDLSEINSVVKMMSYLYQKEAEMNHKDFYCSKGINTFRFIHQIIEEVPTMKFVHLVRDPRDVVASWMKRSSSLRSSYDAILQWKKQQKILIDLRKDNLFNCMSIKYEDLINNPERIMNQILSAIDLPIDQKCYTTNSLNKESEKSEYWTNLSKPIISKNTNKFEDQLCQEDIVMIETIAKEEMSMYGYYPLSSQNWKANKKSINHINKQRRLRKRGTEKSLDDANQLLKSRQILIRKITDQRGKQFQNTLTLIDRMKRLMRINLNILLKKFVLQYLGGLRITFLIRNYINRN